MSKMSERASKEYKKSKSPEGALACCLMTCQRVKVGDEKAKAAVMGYVPVFLSAGTLLFVECSDGQDCHVLISFFPAKSGQKQGFAFEGNSFFLPCSMTVF